jgi:hypothetical protein
MADNSRSSESLLGLLFSVEFVLFCLRDEGDSQLLILQGCCCVPVDGLDLTFC